VIFIPIALPDATAVLALLVAISTVALDISIRIHLGDVVGDLDG
jgi:hypothetical protein